MRYGFSSGAAFADGHTLLTASGKDLFQQLLEIGVLYCEVKCSVSAIGAIVVWLFVALELEQLEADAIGSRQMRDPQAVPALNLRTALIVQVKTMVRLPLYSKFFWGCPQTVLVGYAEPSGHSLPMHCLRLRQPAFASSGGTSSPRYH